MRRIVPALALLSALALPAAAFADTDSTFDVKGHGLSLTFTLPTNPVPDGHDPHEDFYLGNITFVEDGTAMTASDVFFFNKANGGGFDLVDSDNNVIDGLDFYGPKLFTGGVKNPTFKEGKFTLTGGPSCGGIGVADATSADSDCSYKLRISTTPASATPEPSSLLLLGSGTLGALNLVRRRFAR